MPSYTKLNGFELRVVDASGRPMGQGRSPGMHLSNVINRMAVEFGAKIDGIAGEQEGVRMLSGFGLERCIDFAFRGHECEACGARSKGMIRLSLDAWGSQPFLLGQGQWYVRENVQLQGELQSDGIYMTPDGFNPDPWNVNESYKATWKNQRKFEDPIERKKHFWRWEVQDMAYCRALGTRETIYFILWVGGDYSFREGHGPQVVPYRVTYTQEELDMNWSFVLRYRDLLVAEGFE